MTHVARSHFLAAVVGGLIVGAGLLVFGAAGRGHTETIVEEAPVASQPVAGASGAQSGLTPHDIYQRDAPGVVYIRAKLVAPAESAFNTFHAPGSGTSTGSGFLVDRHGDVLTDYHVVDGADRSRGVTAEFEGNIVRPAGVIAVDPSSDLAVLHIDMRGLPAVRPLTLGESSTVRVGDPTLTIGNPFGVDRTLTSGIVSALAHRLPAGDGEAIDNVIQTDQPIDPGDSGGPLLDAGGQVIGINSEVTTPRSGGRSAETLAFAVPIDTADEILSRAAHAGPVRVADIGLGAGPTHGGAGPSGGSSAGARITSVVRGGPAAVAGLRRGDVIERVDGDPVASMSDVLARVTTRSPGQSLVLTLRRGHRLRTITVVLGSRTAPASSGGQ
ncbi:MAG TPA: trypsin-like peptidase domain-containing protein [Solirubrobacteraceae bacterium]|nr:trypsin-like peptidase domain-containing protein [Solirubrobacteraceae bacterium]